MKRSDHSTFRLQIDGGRRSRIIPTVHNVLRRMTRLAFGWLVLALLGETVSLMVAVSPVQAGTRDQAMSKAFGCAEIGDARLWLDCYYGAAQPVRAALRLRPASPAQIALAQSPPAGSALQAADIRESVLSGAARCGQLDDDRRWLDCYYAAAQPMRAYLNLPPAPRLPQALNTGDGFGWGNATSRSAAVTVRMLSYKFDRRGIFTVTLTNGEVWRQLSGDTSFARWKGEPQKYSVRISHGLLGSYNLEVLENPGMFKVHRVR